MNIDERSGCGRVSLHVRSMSRPDGITDEYGFDVDGRLTSRVAKDASGTVIDQADYTYDMAGLRDSLTDLAGVHDYTYDDDGRLTGVDNPAGGLADEAFSYDNLGNLTSWPGNPASQVQHNQADALTQDAKNTCTYDHEGNLTQTEDRTTGDITGYTWNSQHQLTKITRADGTTDTYGYGPLGRRLTATNSLTGTSVFVWAGANLRATLDGTGQLVSRNISTQQLNGTLAVATGDGATIYPLKDGLGSTTATTNGVGAVTSTTAYSAYGTPTTTGNDSGVGQIAGYTGHQTNPDGLIYARARHYNPTTGTFLSEDPAPSSNQYEYAGGDPANHADPSGASFVEEIESGIKTGAVIGGLTGGGVGAVACYDISDRVARFECLVGFIGAGTVAGAAGGAVSGSLSAGVYAAWSGPPAGIGVSLALACWFGGIGGAFYEGPIFSLVTGAELPGSIETTQNEIKGCAFGISGGIGT